MSIGATTQRDAQRMILRLAARFDIAGTRQRVDRDHYCLTNFCTTPVS